MSFPPGVIGAARDLLKQPRFEDYSFVPLQETVTIGYVLGAGPHDADTAVGVPIQSDCFRGVQTFRIQLVQDQDNPELYWVKVAQSIGAVVYTWTSNGKQYHFLAVASDRPEDAPLMRLAEAGINRRQVTLRLHLESGLPYDVLRRLVRVVSLYSMGNLAIGLASWLLQVTQGDLAAAQDRADRLTLMKNDARLRALEGYGPAARMRNGDALAHLVQGAKIILNGYGQTQK